MKLVSYDFGAHTASAPVPVVKVHDFGTYTLRKTYAYVDLPVAAQVQRLAVCICMGGSCKDTTYLKRRPSSIQGRHMYTVYFPYQQLLSKFFSSFSVQCKKY